MKTSFGIVIPDTLFVTVSILMLIMSSFSYGVTIAGYEINDNTLAFIDSEYVTINKTIPLDIADGLAVVNGTTKAPMYDNQAISWATDRDAVDQVLRRTEALYTALSAAPESRDCAQCSTILKAGHQRLPWARRSVLICSANCAPCAVRLPMPTRCFRLIKSSLSRQVKVSVCFSSRRPITGKNTAVRDCRFCLSGKAQHLLSSH